MKSKRQEELPKKTLSRSMPGSVPGWQDFLRQHSSRILLGLTLAVLAVLIFRYRTESARQRALTARAASSRAQQDLRQLKQAMEVSGAQPEVLAARRDQLTSQIMADLSEALTDSGDSDLAVRADAYATRGDLYWTLANSPVFPEAATRPSLGTKDSPDTLLSEAEADYRHVLDQYPNQIMDWAVAELGLAAIAENRGDWDGARKRYDEIENRTDAPDMVKSAAQVHMGLLDRIRQPVLLGPYPATTAPTTTAPTGPTPTPGKTPMTPAATSTQASH